MISTRKARSFADWHVVGAGNLGCMWAVRLHLAGHRSHLILKDAAKLSAYHGIRLHSGPSPRWDDYAIPAFVLPPQCISEEFQKHLNHVLLTTKSHAVIPALQQLRPYLASQLTLIVLQNGLVDRSAVRSIVGTDACVYAATTTEGVHSSRPFHIHQAGDGETLVGALDSLNEFETNRRKEELVIPGMRWVKDLHFVLWRKLAVNCVICALTALYQCRNGELPTIVPNFDDLSRNIVEEVVIMAKAVDGVVLDVDDALWYTRAVISNTAANKSSMYQDVTSRRRTEIDAINGFVAQKADVMDLSAPQNRALTEKIKALESTYFSS